MYAIPRPCLLACGLLLLAGVAAAAAQTTGAGTKAEPPSVPPVSGAPPQAAGPQMPVLRVTSVEVMRSAHEPLLDVIRVRGLASSSGWEAAELIPLTRGTPADGVLHLLLVAQAPAAAVEADGFETIEAIFPIEPTHPFKGVNVHSASDSVIVSPLPGYAEGKAGGEDCAKCVGKTFIARGASAPPGKSAAELVREEQLPANTRLIHAGDGIPGAESNPNRLTLILGADGRITAAVWE